MKPLAVSLAAFVFFAPHYPPHHGKPTATPTATPTPSATVEATASPSPSATSTAILAPTDTATPTATATATATPSACGSLQALIDAAPSGSTLTVPNCTYRESVTISKPLTLDGQGLAQIKGSDVWLDWAWNGNAWQSTQTYPNVGDDSVSGSTVGYVDKFRAFNLEQVFLSGAPLARVPYGGIGTAPPQVGQFALDANRHVLLGDNPLGRLVEVTTRKKWITTNSDGVTITNMVFHHAATAAFEHAIGNGGRVGFKVTNSLMTDAHGSMLGGGELIAGNTFINAGDLAVDGYGANGMLIQSNVFKHNGWGGWSQDWQAGAVKMVTNTNLVIDRNTAEDSYGPSFWCDIHCDGVTISNNVVKRNVQGTGIFYEISTNGQIYGNTICDTTDRNPIGVGESGHTNVYSNVAVRSLSIRAWAYPRSDALADSGTFITLQNNSAVSPIDGVATSWGNIAPGVNGNVDQSNAVVTGPVPASCG